MAKRRIRNLADKDPEELTAEERRALRKRERAAGGTDRAVRPKGGFPWRRAAAIGIPAVVVVAIIVVLLVNPFHANPPCLQFTTSPSGEPAFPPKGTTDFSTTWCPGNAPLIMHLHPYVKIAINGHSIGVGESGLPPSIGRDSNYTNYECDLPIHTHPPGPGEPSPAGILHIESPWAYIFNLSMLFSEWSQSYSGAYVNQSNTQAPITYTPTDLLGYQADPGHSVTLFVDNQLSSDGPNLNLDVLPYLSDPFPACVGTIYGTGHTILLSYQARSAVALGVGTGIHGATASTAAADPELNGLLFDSPMPHVGSTIAHASDLTRLRYAGLGWLSLRPQ